jgi:hypothetical protein
MIVGTPGEADLLRARGCTADGFMIKPVDLHGLVEVVRAISDLQLTVVHAGSRDESDAGAQPDLR